MKMKTNAVVALLGVGMLSVPTFAQSESLKDKLDNIQISGFVDTSVFSSNVKNANGTTTRGFGLDQVELDIEFHEGNVGLRFDLNASPSAGGNVTQDGLIEQGYLTYTIPSIADEGLTFTFGKFNAPIGWELLDAPDMYQFSHALVFNYGIPTNLTGVMASAKYSILDLSIYLTNGTDVNGTQANGMKTYGGRLGVTPIEGLNVGFSYIVDKNRNNIITLGNPASTIADVDLTIDAIENLIIGAEYNETKGFQNDATVAYAGPAIKSRAYMVMAHYDFTEMFGATARYDVFDFDRALTGRSTAYTGAITASLGGGLGALLEVRSDKNSAVATDANGTPANKTVKTYAFEMTYAF